ncbi:MAG: GspH/FimT family pseudopilin [Steroidobacteraceae bacterium]
MPRPVPSPSLRAAAGVTLIELMVVIAIITILLTIGIPSYKYINTSYQVSGEANGLLGDLQFARVEAIKEGQPVTVCASSDGAGCSGNTTWQSGWIVFSDPNASQTVDAGDTVLRVQAAFTSTDTFEPSTALSAVTFNREGFAQNLPNAGVTLVLHDATTNSIWTRCLTMTIVGQMTVQSHTTSAACL